eukprot:6471032-Amphidinium_carterae.2
MGQGLSKGGKGFTGKAGGKGGGKSKVMDSFHHARQARDERRVVHGVQQLSRGDLARSFRCWRCGQVGRLSRNCPLPHPTLSATSAGSVQQSYFMVPFRDTVEAIPLNYFV